MHFDGFLIHVVSSDQISAFSLIPIEAFDKPHHGAVWLTTSNQFDCVNNGGLVANNTATTNSSQVSCLCSFDNCTLLYGGREPYCKGVDFWTQERGFISVKPETRRLSFDVEFREVYAITLLPYYRQFVSVPPSYPQTITSKAECIETLLLLFNMSNLEATEICCDLGVSHVRARNVTILNIIPDFGRNSVSATLQWLPPVSQQGLKTFRLLALAENLHPARPQNDITQVSFTPVERLLNNLQNQSVAHCDNLTYLYRTTAHGLLPGHTFRLIIYSLYDDVGAEEFSCDDGSCHTYFQIKVPKVNPCDVGYCDENASCITEDPSGAMTLNASCTCNLGFSGNGVNPTADELGNGCREISLCEHPPHSCSKSALCVDKPAPESGSWCRCLPGFHGDGSLDAKSRY
ncbi:unnamed protein product [Clavelina lepadiformis]|uniref:EGF-like domain-containing protein n=1 Tax=Clavelina lepadiformis TaxID=159417 RepID=A0ABP0EYR0_CLALP